MFSRNGEKIVRALRFKHSSPEPGSWEATLKTNASRERERRKQLLDTQAHINVAEGHKQRLSWSQKAAMFRVPFPFR